MKIGDEIILRGKSHKGKNRIKEQGELWVIEQTSMSVGFSTPGAGPFLFIKALSGHKDGVRWVASINDRDFEIVE